MEGRKFYGYMRCSSREQNEDRQLIALKEMGVPEKQIYMDKQSGKDFNRPQYKRLLRKLDNNSVLFVKSIDRLGRNYADLNEQWRVITKEKKAKTRRIRQRCETVVTARINPTLHRYFSFALFSDFFLKVTKQRILGMGPVYRHMYNKNKCTQ